MGSHRQRQVDLGLGSSSGRVFSGVQPTGVLHIGNYLGALEQIVRLQDVYGACLCCVVDMHAITVACDREALRRHVRLLAATYLASGIDPKRSVIFVQSSVSYHAQLAWVLGCVARVGWLARMTQFKDKTGGHAQGASVGLYTYPVLMAADILLYKATHVPVGEDQKQHLELARDIARKFNRDFAPVFNEKLEPVIVEGAKRIASLRDGTRKMSKSDPSPFAYISLSDADDLIAEKIRKAKTDSFSFPAGKGMLEGRREVTNLLNIYAAFSHLELEQVIERFSRGTLSTFKSALIDLIVARIGPIRDKVTEILNAPDYLDEVLSTGASRARDIARNTYAEVARVVGLSHEGV